MYLTNTKRLIKNLILKNEVTHKLILSLNHIVKGALKHEEKRKKKGGVREEDL